MLEVFNPRRRQVTLPRFDRRYLHRTARNLSATLTALHDRGYVVGDLNESNVLVTPSALVSLIDTDSFQVQEVRGDQTLYHPCPVGKLEYTPPELHGVSIGSVVREPEHDAFALGVLVFQLLMEGSHPFRAQWLGRGDPPPIEVRIAQGVFPYATFPDSRVQPPKGAPDLNRLHPALIELIYRCFIDGHKHPDQRPMPLNWERALAEAENALVLCPSHHLYSNHLKACPYCKTTARNAGRSAPASARGRPEYWRSRGDAGRQSAASAQKTAPPNRTAPPPPGANQRSGATPRSQATARPAGQPPPGAGSAKTQPKTRPAPSWQSFSWNRPASARRAVNWRAVINSFMSSPWPQPAYPAGSPSQPRHTPPPPSQPPPKSQPWRNPAPQPVSLKAWAKPRLSKSVMTGGGQGALIGALIGGLVALITASLSNVAAWILLWALSGAAAGVLRGWKPGYQFSLWIDQAIGWHRVWPALGLLGGALGGMLAGLVIGWWAILPVFIGLFYGARLGMRLGRRTAELGSRLGWERILAGIGAGAAAWFSWHIASWLGGGAVGSLTAQGVTSLAGWLWGGTPSLLVTAGVTGVLCGALAGAVSGCLTDLVGRLSGLVD